MKSIKYCIVFALLPLLLNAQSNPESEPTGFAGDNFSLEGAIELFKNASSLEEFEQKLNEEDNGVNNLDLNDDGEVDYIRVIDNMLDEAHAIVLQVPINEDESQDIAVIEIEKTGDENAILQIIGDPEIYGEEVIIEPYQEESEGSEGRGPAGDDYYTVRLVVNVWFYPCVRYIYTPTYRLWDSPYRWGHYPRYYKPRRVIAWNIFHPRTIGWRTHYRPFTARRIVKAHKVYAPKRKTSVTVKKKTTVVRKNNKNGKVVKRTSKTKVKTTKNSKKTDRKTKKTKTKKTKKKDN